MLFGCIESPYADVSKLFLKCSYSNGTFISEFIKITTRL